MTCVLWFEKLYKSLITINIYDYVNMDDERQLIILQTYFYCHLYIY